MPRSYLCRSAALVLLLVVPASAACGSSTPPPASAAAARSNDVPLVSLRYAPASACAPIEASRAYDEEAYAYAKRVDDIAAEIGRAFHDGGDGLGGATAASERLRERRPELAGAWRSICGALPDHVGAPTLNFVQAKTSAALYRVCTAPRAKAQGNAALRESLEALCREFRAAIGQP